MENTKSIFFFSRAIHRLLASILGVPFLLMVPSAILAQQLTNTGTTDNARVISYQGVAAVNGIPVTGDHLITATLYTDANGTAVATAGASFVITSTTATDVSQVAWMIVEKN